MGEMESFQRQLGDVRQQLGEVIGLLRGSADRDTERKTAMEHLERRLGEMEQSAGTRMTKMEADLTALRREQTELADTMKAASVPLKEFVEWQKRSKVFVAAVGGVFFILWVVFQPVLSNITSHWGDRIYAWMSGGK